MRDTRTLDAVEIRILGSLLEKQLTTPEYYPLTMNALLAACNQKTNREPVTSLTETEVTPAIERLQDEKLVWRVVGGRSTHYDHNTDTRWDIGPASRAILSLLFLRGGQTAGELRSRSERLFRFATIEEMEEQLRAMSVATAPLVRELERRPGQKETRWIHLAGGSAPPEEVVQSGPTSEESGERLSVRMSRLELEVDALKAALAELTSRLGE